MSFLAITASFFVTSVQPQYRYSDFERNPYNFNAKLSNYEQQPWISIGTMTLINRYIWACLPNQCIITWVFFLVLWESIFFSLRIFRWVSGFKLRLFLLVLREKCPYSELFWSTFSRIRTEYREIPCIYPYSVQMRENMGQNNSGYRHSLQRIG